MLDFVPQSPKPAPGESSANGHTASGPQNAAPPCPPLAKGGNAALPHAKGGNGTELPDLIPVRMVNEFSYCPRLAYLEWVQGEWAESLDTLEGTFGHRRVDVPGRKLVPASQPLGLPAPGDELHGASDGETTPTVLQTASDRDVGANDDGTSSRSRRRGRNSKAPVPGKEASGADDGRSADASREPIHARSLSLSAPIEGLTAKLDLLELEGNMATPVDYKRGAAPDLPEGAYEPERAQLCAQGLILRENGYDCRSGVLYFIASRRRVTIEFDDALVARTRLLVSQLREAAASGVTPPPLVDSPKCPRCSLVGICLPDETNFLRRAQEVIDRAEDGEDMIAEAGEQGPEAPVVFQHANGSELPISDGDESDVATASEAGNSASGVGAAIRSARSTAGLRQLIPTRDDALPLYLQDYGLSLGKDGDQLVIKKKGELVKEVRLLDVSQVCLFGSVYMTEPALRELATRGVPVCHLSYGGWFYAMTTGLVHKNVELRIRQYAIAADPQRALPHARRFIAGKMRNCRTMLRRHLNDASKPRLMWQLNEYIRKAEHAESAESLLGIEGMAAKLYFGAFAKLLDGGKDFEIDGRNRRPPCDPVNALLSFLYALLAKELTVTLQAVGFDPMLGLFHQPRYGRPSLALDLAEEFRPLIADSTVLTLVNNGEVSPASFIRRAGAVALTDAGRRAVLTAFERRLDAEVTHPIFGYKVSYRRVLQVQSRLLARAILGELPEYPSFCTR